LTTNNNAQARTLAVQLATNAVLAQIGRIHGRIRLTFADAATIQMMTDLLAELDGPAVMQPQGDEDDTTTLDHGGGTDQSLSLPQMAVAQALGLRDAA